ncbi:hypothetical protein NP233_g817 [Leucocoprinus birnbaumii]|uniref:Uncharacterized protein n=1 Tax=Leucocoprinus birnbaumii TaxID=56174 RepID=A0AAD5W1I9_9AGAR|nr:hypothetical protein NP233_g817 [Leucocoprinus birnbaumii]
MEDKIPALVIDNGTGTTKAGSENAPRAIVPSILGHLRHPTLMLGYKCLYSSIVLSGCNIMLPGFVDRLQKELTALASEHESQGHGPWWQENFRLDWRFNPSVSEHFPEHVVLPTRIR